MLCAVLAFTACTSENGESRLTNNNGDERPPAEYLPAPTAPPMVTDNDADIAVPTPPATSVTLTPAEIFADNVDAVFMIGTFDSNGNLVGTGSGFFINSSGVAITNHHVIVGAQYAIILTEDGREFNIIGYYTYDIDNDLAVIQIDGVGFTYLTIGNSDAVRIGETVFAIGSPYGEHNTFSISYVSRFVPELLADIYAIQNVIQITAPIYGGSSGGALLNEMGQVIGVTTARDLRRPSVGFAVPIARVDLTNVLSNNLSPLPLAAPARDPGVWNFAQFPSVPDFLAVSSNATLILGGTAQDMDFDVGEAYSFSYVFIYELNSRYIWNDTDLYEALLFEAGFIFQEEIDYEGTTQIYYFHPAQNISLLFMYLWDYEAVLIAIGQGNALESLLGFELATLNSPLVGVWRSGHLDIFYFADGTGLMRVYDEDDNFLDESEFTWRSENGYLTYLTGLEAGTVWSYQIVGANVIFTSQTGLILNFERVDYYSTSLLTLGWWMLDNLDLRFYEDGTGVALFFDDDNRFIDEEDFTWVSFNGYLTYLTGPFAGSSWFYVVSNSTVTFTGEDGTVLVFTLDS